MLPAILLLISTGLLFWLIYEIILAIRFTKQSTRVNAVVSRRERVSQGSKGRNTRIWLSFQANEEDKEYPMGFMSWWGFRDLQIGDRLLIRFHRSMSFVVPDGFMGVAARPICAASLLFTSLIFSTAFIF